MPPVAPCPDPKLFDEEGRLAALGRYCAAGCASDPAFEKITSLVKTVLDVPICAVTLIERDRQRFASIAGLDVVETARDIAFCDHTIRARAPMIVPDAAADPRFTGNPLVLGGPGVASYAGVPLETPDGYNIGALCVLDVRPRTFTAAQVAILRSFAQLVVDEFELRTIASKDFLTGAMTRRAFVARAEQELALHRRYDRPCALVVMDIDHFKRVNDTHGHTVGDEVLRAVVQRCDGAMRATDSLGRMGGEEFAVLLPQTAPAEALRCAERLQAAMQAIAIHPAPSLRVTASFGVAPAQSGGDVQQWLAEADAALYAAKRGGRNCCVVASCDLQRRAA